MAYPKAAKGLNLSDEEEKAIVDTWSVLAQDLRGAGVRFFVHLFGQYPEFKKLFRAFAHVPDEELTQNKRFQAHGFTVMTTINGYIQSIDDIEMLREILMKTGYNHANKLTADDFDVVEGLLSTFFEKEWGSAYTPLVASSWKKVLNTVVAIIKEGVAEYNNDQNKA